MEKQILEILLKWAKVSEGKTHVVGRVDAAKEIAEPFRRFNEWKDERLTNSRIVLYNGFYVYGKKYTHDELFTYWFDNIKDK